MERERLITSSSSKRSTFDTWVTMFQIKPECSSQASSEVMCLTFSLVIKCNRKDVPDPKLQVMIVHRRMEVNSLYSWTHHYVKVSGQFHVLATLHRAKRKQHQLTKEWLITDNVKFKYGEWGTKYTHTHKFLLTNVMERGHSGNKGVDRR
jgi:hypothetical protein